MANAALGSRLQVLMLSNRQLTARGSLTLPAASTVRAMGFFGTDFLIGAAGTAGSLVVNITDNNQPAWVAGLGSLDGAVANTLAGQSPHFWSNDRLSDASHLRLGNADSALARYALGGSLPAGLTLTAEGLLRWTLDESQGGLEYDVMFSRTVGGVVEQWVAHLIVDEVNQPPVIAPVAPQSAVASELWSVQVTVSDSDLPVQVLALTTDLADIAVAQATPGVFTLSWRPPSPAAARWITLVASDARGASATNTFQLSVASNFQPLAQPVQRVWTEHIPPPVEDWPFSLIRPYDGRRVQFSLIDRNFL